MKLTSKVKLQPTGEQSDSLKRTLELANAACNYIAVRTAKVEGDKVIESFVWQPGGNIMGYDGPDPDNCQTVEDLERNGYKKRR